MMGDRLKRMDDWCDEEEEHFDQNLAKRYCSSVSASSLSSPERMHSLVLPMTLFGSIIRYASQ